jgi:S-formylglutathione hydrolase FrmB
MRRLLKYITLIATICFSYNITYSQPTGKVIETQTVKSKILNRDVHYTVYLPPDYAVSERSYPVVYLLHGLSGDNMQWVQWGEINRYADKAIGEGTIPPMIIVMPNANRSWYINSYDGKVKYEDFFVKEFIPAVEKAFRIKGEKTYRGIAGLSMGGYGALIYTLKYPELFAAAGALSPGVYEDEEIVNMTEDERKKVYGQVLDTTLLGKDRLNKVWYDNSVLQYVRTKPIIELTKVRYWIDCGDDDFLFKGNCLLHIALTEKKVPHEFRIRDGAHNWTYWRTGITDALKFIGDSFRRL